MNILFRVIFFLFVLSCVFDPADLIFGLKVPLFVLLWFLVLVDNSLKKRFSAPKSLLLYIGIMLVIPFISIGLFLLINPGIKFQGFELFKAYLLVTLALILYWRKFNLMNDLVNILTLLSFTILSFFIVVLYRPDLFETLFSFGSTSGLFYLGEREYSADAKLWSIYFVTSPMILIPIAHFTKSVLEYPKLALNYFFLILNVTAMFVAGTRNNMLMSILLPLLIIFFHIKRKTILLSFLFILGIYFYPLFENYLIAMLSPDEASNSTKIALLKDYSNIFSNLKTLIVGQGLGSYYFWLERGVWKFESEYTYLEIYRYYGLFLGSVLIFLIIYPLIKGFYLIRKYRDKHFLWAYMLYLIMSATNPLFFSSLGMLILSVIMANMYLERFKLSDGDFKNFML